MSGTPTTGFFRAFLSSVLGTGLSRVLGALRDVVIASYFGAGAATDAFYIAFTIPNIFRRFVADEGLTGAMIPALSLAEKDSGERAARTLADQVLGVLLLANVVLCVLGIVFAEAIVLAFASSYAEDPEQLALAVQLTRWLFPFLAMVSMVSYFEGLFNMRGAFFIPKVAPGLVSLGIVLAVTLTGTWWAHPAHALVAGVLAGGVAHVLLHLPWVGSVWGKVRPAWGIRDPRLRGVLREMGKVIAIGVFAQLNILVLRQLAVSAGYGGVSWYWNANRVVDLLQGVIAVAIGSAILPGLARSAARGNIAELRDALHGGLRLAGWLLVPAAGGLYVFSVPFVSILFRHGAYTWDDTLVTASTVQAMIGFFLAVAGINIVRRVYYAINDRTTLLAVGATGVLVTLGLGLTLIPTHGIPGLGYALSIATGLQLIAYLLVLQMRLEGGLQLGRLAPHSLQVASACIPSLMLLYFAKGYGDWALGPADPNNLVVFLLAMLLSVGAYLVTSRLLRIPELMTIGGRISRALWAKQR